MCNNNNSKKYIILRWNIILWYYNEVGDGKKWQIDHPPQGQLKQKIKIKLKGYNHCI